MLGIKGQDFTEIGVSVCTSVCYYYPSITLLFAHIFGHGRLSVTEQAKLRE